MKVFISYAWTDTPIRMAIASELKNLSNVEVFFDKKDLIVAEPLTKGIQNGINQSDTIIAILTESSIKSGAVRDEIARAHERNIEIIPLISDTLDDKNIPIYLKDILQIRFNNAELDVAVSQIVKHLQGDPKKRSARKNQLQEGLIHTSNTSKHT